MSSKFGRFRTRLSKIELTLKREKSSLPKKQERMRVIAKLHTIELMKKGLTSRIQLFLQILQEHLISKDKTVKKNAETAKKGLDEILSNLLKLDAKSLTFKTYKLNRKKLEGLSKFISENLPLNKAAQAQLKKNVLPVLKLNKEMNEAIKRMPHRIWQIEFFKKILRTSVSSLKTNPYRFKDPAAWRKMVYSVRDALTFFKRRSKDKTFRETDRMQVFAENMLRALNQQEAVRSIVMENDPLKIVEKIVHATANYMVANYNKDPIARGLIMSYSQDKGFKKLDFIPLIPREFSWAKFSTYTPEQQKEIKKLQAFLRIQIRTMIKGDSPLYGRFMKDPKSKAKKRHITDLFRTEKIPEKKALVLDHIIALRRNKLYPLLKTELEKLLADDINAGLERIKKDPTFIKEVREKKREETKQFDNVLWKKHAQKKFKAHFVRQGFRGVKLTARLEQERQIQRKNYIASQVHQYKIKHLFAYNKNNKYFKPPTDPFKKKLWELYNDVYDPQNEWGNVADTTEDMFYKELLINAPLILLSGGLASAGRAAVSYGGRAIAGALARSTILSRVALTGVSAARIGGVAIRTIGAGAARLFGQAALGIGRFSFSAINYMGLGIPRVTARAIGWVATNIPGLSHTLRFGAWAARGAGSLAARGAVHAPGLLLEGALFEVANYKIHQYLFEHRNQFKKDKQGRVKIADWVKPIIFSSITLGLFHGAHAFGGRITRGLAKTKMGDDAIQAVEKQSRRIVDIKKSLEKGIEAVIVDTNTRIVLRGLLSAGLLEPVALILSSAIHKSYAAFERNNFSLADLANIENLLITLQPLYASFGKLDEWQHAYMTVAALKANSYSITAAGWARRKANVGGRINKRFKITQRLSKFVPKKLREWRERQKDFQELGDYISTEWITELMTNRALRKNYYALATKKVPKEALDRAKEIAKSQGVDPSTITAESIPAWTGKDGVMYLNPKYFGKVFNTKNETINGSTYDVSITMNQGGGGKGIFFTLRIAKDGVQFKEIKLSMTEIMHMFKYGERQMPRRIPKELREAVLAKSKEVGKKLAETVAHEKVHIILETKFQDVELQNDLVDFFNDRKKLKDHDFFERNELNFENIQEFIAKVMDGSILLKVDTAIALEGYLQTVLGTNFKMFTGKQSAKSHGHAIASPKNLGEYYRQLLKTTKVKRLKRSSAVPMVDAGPLDALQQTNSRKATEAETRMGALEKKAFDTSNTEALHALRPLRDAFIGHISTARKHLQQAKKAKGIADKRRHIVHAERALSKALKELKKAETILKKHGITIPKAGSTPFAKAAKKAKAASRKPSTPKTPKAKTKPKTTTTTPTAPKKTTKATTPKAAPKKTAPKPAPKKTTDKAELRKTEQAYVREIKQRLDAEFAEKDPVKRKALEKERLELMQKRRQARPETNEITLQSDIAIQKKLLIKLRNEHTANEKAYDLAMRELIKKTETEANPQKLQENQQAQTALTQKRTRERTAEQQTRRQLTDNTKQKMEQLGTLQKKSPQDIAKDKKALEDREQATANKPEIWKGLRDTIRQRIKRKKEQEAERKKKEAKKKAEQEQLKRLQEKIKREKEAREKEREEKENKEVDKLKLQLDLEFSRIEKKLENEAKRDKEAIDKQDISESLKKELKSERDALLKRQKEALAKMKETADRYAENAKKKVSRKKIDNLKKKQKEMRERLKKKQELFKQQRERLKQNRKRRIDREKAAKQKQKQTKDKRTKQERLRDALRDKRIGSRERLRGKRRLRNKLRATKRPANMREEERKRTELIKRNVKEFFASLPLSITFNIGGVDVKITFERQKAAPKAPVQKVVIKADGKKIGEISNNGKDPVLELLSQLQGGVARKINEFAVPLVVITKLEKERIKQHLFQSLQENFRRTIFRAVLKERLGAIYDPLSEKVRYNNKNYSLEASTEGFTLYKLGVGGAKSSEGIFTSFQEFCISKAAAKQALKLQIALIEKRFPDKVTTKTQTPQAIRKTNERSVMTGVLSMSTVKTAMKYMPAYQNASVFSWGLIAGTAALAAAYQGKKRVIPTIAQKGLTQVAPEVSPTTQKTIETLAKANDSIKKAPRTNTTIAKTQAYTWPISVLAPQLREIGFDQKDISNALISSLALIQKGKIKLSYTLPGSTTKHSLSPTSNIFKQISKLTAEGAIVNLDITKNKVLSRSKIREAMKKSASHRKEIHKKWFAYRGTRTLKTGRMSYQAKRDYLFYLQALKRKEKDAKIEQIA